MSSERGITRRSLLIGGGAAIAAAGAAAFVVRYKRISRIDRMTIVPSFSATPALLPHDPVKDKATLYIGKDASPAANIDTALGKLGGIGKIIGPDDIVAIKVSAHWWNQGMTNVDDVKRVVEHILEFPGFKREVVIFANTHFRFPDKAVDDPTRGLTRAFTHPSRVNVDVPGWDKLGDLGPHFAKLNAPFSMVGLVDAGASSLAKNAWSGGCIVVWRDFASSYDLRAQRFDRNGNKVWTANGVAVVSAAGPSRSTTWRPMARAER